MQCGLTVSMSTSCFFAVSQQIITTRNTTVQRETPRMMKGSEITQGSIDGEGPGCVLSSSMIVAFPEKLPRLWWRGHLGRIRSFLSASTTPSKITSGALSTLLDLSMPAFFPQNPSVIQTKICSQELCKKKRT